MAADIKNYLKEKEKRQKNQDDYKKKIRKHKLTIVYRVLLVAAALGAALALVVVQAKRHIYTGYDTVSSVNRETSSDAIDVRLKNGILTYSKDGAHCTDAKGNVKWNQTYVIQDVKLATCGSAAAIGSYNGREIYVQNTEKQLGTITTTMPIRNITVADTGRVTATLADTDATWIMTYEADGSNSYTGQAHMNDGGYPISISLSPSGELLAVSYLYVDAGVVKSNVVFYNFGPVGANQSDYMVSGVYFTSQAITEAEAVEEANVVLNNIKDYKITYPVAFDMGFVDNDTARIEGVSRADKTKITKAFLDTIAAAGYKTLLYGNKEWLIKEVDLSKLSAYDVWLSQVGDVPDYPYRFTMWQYADDISVDGIAGYSNMNISFIDYSEK